MEADTESDQATIAQLDKFEREAASGDVTLEEVDGSEDIENDVKQVLAHVNRTIKVEDTPDTDDSTEMMEVTELEVYDQDAASTDPSSKARMFGTSAASSSSTSTIVVMPEGSSSTAKVPVAAKLTHSQNLYILNELETFFGDNKPTSVDDLLKIATKTTPQGEELWQTICDKLNERYAANYTCMGVYYRWQLMVHTFRYTKGNRLASKYNAQVGALIKDWTGASQDDIATDVNHDGMQDEEDVKGENKRSIGGAKAVKVSRIQNDTESSTSAKSGIVLTDGEVGFLINQVKQLLGKQKPKNANALHSAVVQAAYRHTGDFFKQVSQRMSSRFNKPFTKSAVLSIWRTLVSEFNGVVSNIKAKGIATTSFRYVTEMTSLIADKTLGQSSDASSFSPKKSGAKQISLGGKFVARAPPELDEHGRIPEYAALDIENMTEHKAWVHDEVVFIIECVRETYCSVEPAKNLEHLDAIMHRSTMSIAQFWDLVTQKLAVNFGMLYNKKRAYRKWKYLTDTFRVVMNGGDEYRKAKYPFRDEMMGLIQEFTPGDGAVKSSTRKSYMLNDILDGENYDSEDDEPVVKRSRSDDDTGAAVHELLKYLKDRDRKQDQFNNSLLSEMRLMRKTMTSFMERLIEMNGQL